MVAELLTRSPDNLLGTLEIPPSNMDSTPGSAHGESFVQSGVENMQTIEFDVGGTIVKAVMTGAGMIAGTGALIEAKDAVVSGLTHVFGKYQKKVEEVSELSEIQDNDLDGTATNDAEQQPRPTTDDDDIATASVSYKKAKFEALAF